MRRFLRTLILMAILFSLGGVVYKVVQNLWLQQAGAFKERPAELLNLLPEAVLELKEFRRSKVEEGRKVWEVTGKRAVYLKKDEEAVIEEPRLVFFQEDGKPIEVQGEEGRIIFHDGEMEKVWLKGDVRVHFQGFLLRTGEILYLKSEDHLVSPEKVVVTGHGVEVEGVGLEIGLKDQRMLLRDKVRTKIRPNRLQDKQAEQDKQDKQVEGV